MACRQYKWLVAFLILVITVPLVVGVMMSHHLRKRATSKAMNANKRIEYELITLFHAAHEMMIAIGQEISKDSGENLYQIWSRLSEIFGQTKSIKKSYVWPEMAWVDTSMHQLVSTRVGVSGHPIDLSIRDYTKVVFQAPWQLHFATPGTILPIDGKRSHILPFGMGISNKDGKFIGIVTGCFYKQDIFNKINNLIQNKEVSFVVLYNKNKIFIQTLGKSLKEDNFLSDDFSSLFVCCYINHILDIPFTVVTYLDNGDYYHDYYRLFLPFLFKWICGVFFVAILVFVFCYQVKNQNQKLEKIKNDLKKAIEIAACARVKRENTTIEMQKKLKDPFIIIVTYTEVIIKQLKHEIDLDLSFQKKIQFLEKIKLALFDIKKFLKSNNIN